MTTALPLGRTSDSAPTAVFAADGELLFGEAATRRGLMQPDRLVREFKRRVGDDVPLAVGGQRLAAEDLFARTVAWVVDTVVVREGAPPAGISVTVPATWGGHRSAIVSAALAREVSPDVELISEPEAAARHYEATSPLEPGRALAVYDLGGGTFDAAILRKRPDGMVEIAGDPLGIHDFGGADFDDAVFRHVVTAAGLSLEELAADSAAMSAMATLRRECIEAKEALSFDADAAVPILVSAAHTTVRVTRSEFEAMIADGVQRTIDVLARALDDASATTEVDAVLLTGGSSRIPFIAERLSERFDLPIAVDTDPKAIVSLGAARALALARLAVEPAGADEPSIAETALPLPGPAEDAARRRWFGRVSSAAAIGAGALVVTAGILVAGATELGDSAPTGDAAAAADSRLGVLVFDKVLAATQAPIDAPPPTAPVSSGPGAETAAPETRQRASNPRSPARASSRSTASSPASSTATGPTGSAQTPRQSGPSPSATAPAPPAPSPAPTVADPGPTPDPTTDPTPDPTPPDPPPDPQPPSPEPEPEPTPTDPT